MSGGEKSPKRPPKKISKKVKKPLDKQHKVCYNKYVIKREKNLSLIIKLREGKPLKNQKGDPYVLFHL
jgi:hypothetical protein